MNQLRIAAVRSLAVPSSGWTQFNLGQFMQRLFCSPWTMLVCKLTIGVVSAYDIYLTIKYVESLPYLELNPLGRWLMNLDIGPNSSINECDLKQVASFITAKFVGNFIALTVIELLSAWKQTIASAVAFPVALFQIILLYFLLFGGN